MKIYSIKTFSFILLVTLLLSPVICLAQIVNIEGRVFTEHGPLKGARVYVFKSYQDIFSDQPFLASGPTDIKGVYKLQLLHGEYYFIARGDHNGRSFYAYHGSNPMRLETTNIWLSLIANEVKEPLYTDGATAVQGTVTYKGKPVKGANIAFYSLENSIFKGLGFLAGKGIGFMESVGQDGTFKFALKPNKYVVIARKLQEGRSINLLQRGELYCYYPPNPIEIIPGKTVSIEVPCYPKADRLAFVGSPKIKANDYPTIEDLAELDGYGIKGRVMDAKGNPVQGAYVIAYRVDSPTLTHESKNIAVTDAKGNYFMPLDTSGNYGLVARITLGRAPKPDDLTGLHDKNPWKGIAFQTGQVIENINITIRPTFGDDEAGKK